MAALAVESGETLSVETIVQLRGQIEAFYILITLQSRSFDFIQQHRAVWKNAYEFFNAAVLIWERVPIDGELVRAHCHALANWREIVRDRLEFYSLTESDRRDYKRRKVEDQYRRDPGANGEDLPGEKS
jgi:hypothetical protein